MRVLLFEENLLWSSRLRRSLEGMGHSVVVARATDSEFRDVDAAIVDLGTETSSLDDLLQKLRHRSIRVLGHAGHKEKAKLEAGRVAGCDLVVTNSEITFKLADALERLTAPG